MPTTFAPVIGLSPNLTAQTCNCHYPVGLVIFLLFTICSLLICIFVCCCDVCQCVVCQRSISESKFRRSSINSKFVEPSKFFLERKISTAEPIYLEYKQLTNNSGSSGSSSKFKYMEQPSFSTDISHVSLV